MVRPRGVGISAICKFTGPETILSLGLITAFLKFKIKMRMF